MAWNLSEAAAFRAASATAFLREIATDGVALRGAHKLLSIAKRRGAEVTFAGVKFSGLQTQAELARGRQSKQAGLGSHPRRSADEDRSNADRRRRRADPLSVHAADAASPLELGRPKGRTLAGGGSADPHSGFPVAPLRRAPKAKRFGIKKATQKMRAAARVGAGLRRWLSRARGRAAPQAAGLARRRSPDDLAAPPLPPLPPSPISRRRTACSSTTRIRPGSNALAHPQSLPPAGSMQVWGRYPWGQPGPHQEARHGRAGRMVQGGWAKSPAPRRCGLL